MPASSEMESFFRASPERLGQFPRVLIEADRPLGARTVVVQLLKIARMRMAPSVERRMVRMFSFVAYYDSQTGGHVHASLLQRQVTLRQIALSKRVG